MLDIDNESDHIENNTTTSKATKRNPALLLQSHSSLIIICEFQKRVTHICRLEL